MGKTRTTIKARLNNEKKSKKVSRKAERKQN
jgi:hypothetical protein